MFLLEELMGSNDVYCFYFSLKIKSLILSSFNEDAHVFRRVKGLITFKAYGIQLYW